MKSPEEMAREIFARREAYARRQDRRECIRELVGRGASAAVLTVMLFGMIGLGCAFAASADLGDLFLSLFSSQQGSALSENQGSYIEEHKADIGESVTVDGYTVTVKGALTDGTTAHILLDLVVPENVDLESISPGFDLTVHGLCTEDQHGIGSVGTTFWHLEDFDGKANTVSLNMEYTVYTMPGSNFTLADGRNRTFRLADLQYVENEYPYNVCHVAEGPWIFDFAFTAMENREVELLQTPIYGTYRQISGKQAAATITSVVMKGLSTTVYYTLAADEVQEAGDFGAIKFVMKDGSEQFAYPDKAGQTAQIGEDGLVPGTNCHYCTYVFLAPIAYEDVAAVQIGENMIRVSEN